jgi:hypothetical protein
MMFKPRGLALWLGVVLLSLGGEVFGEPGAAADQAPSTGPASSSITFLTAEQARTAIVDDSLDPYFEKLQPMEMSAKTGRAITGKTLAEQRAECRRRYQAEVRDFTMEEKETLRSLVEQLSPALRKDYPLFAETPWSFLKVSHRVEGGLPHTRGKHIVLPEGFCLRLVAQMRNDPHGGNSWVCNLLVHEQMHVFQRLHPGVLDDLYTKVWGFERAEDIQGCPWLTSHHVVNPDGADCCWVFPIRNGEGTNYIWPLVIFREGEGLKRMPRDFRMVAIELDKTEKGFRVRVDEDGKPVFRNLLRVPEYRKAFAPSRNIYHPHEASADMFAMIVLSDASILEGGPPDSRRDTAKETLEAERKWFRRNLRAKGTR